MPIPRAEQDRGRRKRRSCPHQPGADYCQQLALTRSSALTQHALPGPELSWSRSPWGQGGQKKQEVWDGLSPGAGSPKRQALSSALPHTPHRPLLARPLPLALPWGPFWGLVGIEKSRCVMGLFKAQSQASLRGPISRFKDRGCTGGGENVLVLMKW